LSTSWTAQEDEDVLDHPRIQVSLALKNVQRLSDLVGLQQAVPSGSDQQGSRS
jgi:hypothetical protein